MLLLSLAFMATGGFMGLHAFGTHDVLFSESRAGFQIALPIGLLVSAFFAALRRSSIPGPSSGRG